MSKSKPANKFRFIAAGVFLVAAGVCVAIIPVIKGYVSDRSSRYATVARHSHDPVKQIGNYRLALTLDPDNSAYRNELASVYITQNNLKGAISVLGNTVGERVRKANYQLSLGSYKQAGASIASLNSPEAAIVRSKIALEQGSALAAYQAVKNARNDSERLQLGLSYAVAGMLDEVKETFSVMKDSEAKRRLERAEGGGVALAQELYRERLYRTTERVLAQAGGSGEKYLLLAHVQLETTATAKKDRQAALEKAKDSLAKGIERDPANLKLHELLVEVYRHLEDNGGVSRENAVIQKLRSGKL